MPLIKYRYHNGTHQKNIIKVAELNSAIKLQHIANLLPQLSKDMQTNLAYYLNRHLKHNYTAEWFNKMIVFFDEVINLSKQDKMLIIQLNNCVWFHFATSPKHYFKLSILTRKSKWVNIGLLKICWLLIKFIYKLPRN